MDSTAMVGFKFQSLLSLIIYIVCYAKNTALPCEWSKSHFALEVEINGGLECKNYQKIIHGQLAGDVRSELSKKFYVEQPDLQAGVCASRSNGVFHGGGYCYYCTKSSKVVPTEEKLRVSYFNSTYAPFIEASLKNKLNQIECLRDAEIKVYVEERPMSIKSRSNCLRKILKKSRSSANRKRTVSQLSLMANLMDQALAKQPEDI